MHNPIAQNIFDFLKKYEPFNFLTVEELFEVCEKSKIHYFEKNQILFQINEKTHDSFYVVQNGEIVLNITSDKDDVLIDKCDAGDIIGLRPFFAKNNYLMTAKAREESFLISIPIETFKPFIENNQNVLHFLLESFASNTRNPHDKIHKGKLISENFIKDDHSSEIAYYQPIEYPTVAFTAKASNTVKNVAQKMVELKIGSVIVEKGKMPIGIVTDKDLSSKIATGLFSIDAEIKEIMSNPVITVAEHLSVAEAQIMMLKNNVGHLCVTKDGTIHSEIKGVISEHDIIVAQANNPGVLLKQAKRASKSLELKLVRDKVKNLIQQSLEKNIPLNHIASIVGEINIAITRRTIELSIEKMNTPPPTQFAWLHIGSQGRKEQLLNTDQDSALIFEDVPDNKYDEVKNYFIDLADKTTKTLQKLGFEFCLNETMANNAKYCKSYTEWKKQYNLWINAPEEHNAILNSIFFDFDFVYGQESLIEKLSVGIYDNINDNELFFAYLGSDMVKSPPPLGFFKQFLVENNGEHKDTFNIKSRAITPLVDAARILILQKNIKNINNTYLRYLKLAELEPQNQDLFEGCAEAFLLLSLFRTEEGLKNNSNGNYLNLNTLSKFDKAKLKNSFYPIERIQEIIKTRFQLTYFS